jgi:hypothetical protein
MTDDPKAPAADADLPLDADEPASDRKPTFFRLTDRANRGLDRLAIQTGATKVTLVEALGRLADKPGLTIDEVAELAKRLDGKRRSRRRLADCEPDTARPRPDQRP